MKKIKLLIDEVEYKEKPEKKEIASIQVRLRKEKAKKEVTIEELFEYIKRGCTIVPALTAGGATNENWEEQQLIGVDIDNDGDKIITLEEAMSMLEEKNITPVGYYYTFHHTDKQPRYRLLFLLDRPYTDRNKITFIIDTFISFLCGDNACSNVSRLFFGTDGQTKKVAIVNPNSMVTLEDVMRLTKSPSIEDYNKEDDLKQAVKNFDLFNAIRNFDLLEYMKRENEVDRVSSNLTYFKNCSVCGHKECLVYYSGTNSFYCFGQNGRKGGTIIDYISATKKISISEAINYFKYEILKLPRTSLRNQESGDFEEYYKKICENVSKLGYEPPEAIDWICINDNGKLKLSRPKLSEYIAKNVPYIFAKSNTKSGVIKFFYQDNRYVVLDEDSICSFISKFVEPIDLHTMGNFNEVLKLMGIKEGHIKSLDDMNSDEDIINFKNCILNVKTGEKIPHSCEYLTSVQIPCNYIEDCPKPPTGYFDKYLDDLTNGDEKVKKLILQGGGVAISNVHGYRMKQAFFFVGPGNSGKSQWKLLLMKLLGPENCTSIDLKDLEKPFHTIELLNKRLAGSNDMSGMKIGSLEKFKQLTGGDYVSDSFKNEGHIDFRFNGVIWMLGNRMPVFGGDKGEHVYDRMIIVECDNVIPKEQRDKHLLEHLLEEKEYIVSLFIKGLKEVIANDYAYDIPQSCEERNKLYRIENDSFLSFMEECVVDRPKGEPIKDKCTTKMFYDTYKEWCKNNNNGYAQTKKEMKQMLIDMGKGEIIHTNGGNNYFRDVTISEEAKIEFSSVCRDYSADDYSPSNYIVEDDGFDF